MTMCTADSARKKQFAFVENLKVTFCGNKMKHLNGLLRQFAQINGLASMRFQNMDDDLDDSSEWGRSLFTSILFVIEMWVQLKQ